MTAELSGGCNVLPANCTRSSRPVTCGIKIKAQVMVHFSERQLVAFCSSWCVVASVAPCSRKETDLQASADFHLWLPL